LNKPSAVIEEHWINVTEGRHRLWLVRPAGSGPFPAVVWNHGSQVWYNEDGKLEDHCEEPQIVGDGWHWKSWAEQSGYLILIPEGRGYAGSDGPRLSDVLYSPTGVMDFLAGRSEDVEAAVTWLLSRDDVDKDRLAMTGISHGGVVALLASARQRYAATIIQGTGPWYQRADVGLDILQKAAAHVKGPLLVQHFLTDSLVPVEVSRYIYEAAKKAERDIQLCEYPGTPGVEGHFFHDPRNRHEWLDDHNRFLARRFAGPK